MTPTSSSRSRRGLLRFLAILVALPVVAGLSACVADDDPPGELTNRPVQAAPDRTTLPPMAKPQPAPAGLPATNPEPPPPANADDPPLSSPSTAPTDSSEPQSQPPHEHEKP